jgi:hypothetical protein
MSGECFGVMESGISVMPALVAGIHVFLIDLKEARRGWPGIRAFTPVFHGLLPGHDGVLFESPML